MRESGIIAVCNADLLNRLILGNDHETARRDNSPQRTHKIYVCWFKCPDSVSNVSQFPERYVRPRHVERRKVQPMEHSVQERDSGYRYRKDARSVMAQNWGLQCIDWNSKSVEMEAVSTSCV